MSGRPAPIRASLFVTCVVDQFYPEIGESAVRVLRRLGVEVDFPGGQTCCGQPAFNSGFWSDARPIAGRFLRVFRDQPYIVTPSGSCASMVRVFYSDLFRDEPALLETAREVGPRVYELSEFIVDVLGLSSLPRAEDEGPTSSPRRVSYHESCHLRTELGASTQARMLIRSVPGVQVVEMGQGDVCCGFGGTFSVKYPNISGAMLRDKIDNIRETGAESVISCDASCLMHIAGGMEKQGGMPVHAIHLAQFLDEAMAPA